MKKILFAAALFLLGLPISKAQAQNSIYYRNSLRIDNLPFIYSIERLDLKTGESKLVTAYFAKEPERGKRLKIWWDGGPIAYGVYSFKTSDISEADYLELYKLDSETGTVLRNAAFPIDASVQRYPLVNIEGSIFHLNNYLLDFDNFDIKYIGRGYVSYDRENSRFIRINPFDSPGIDIVALDYPSLSTEIPKVNFPNVNIGHLKHYTSFLGDGIFVYGTDNRTTPYFFKVTGNTITQTDPIPNARSEDIGLHNLENTYIVVRNDEIIEVNRETGATVQTLFNGGNSFVFSGGGFFGVISDFGSADLQNLENQTNQFQIFQSSDLSRTTKDLTLDLSDSLPFSNYLRGDGPIIDNIRDIEIDDNSGTLYLATGSSIIAVDIATGNRELISNRGSDLITLGPAIPILNEDAQPASPDQIFYHIIGSNKLDLQEFDADPNRDGAVDSADAKEAE